MSLFISLLSDFVAPCIMVLSSYRALVESETLRETSFEPCRLGRVSYAAVMMAVTILVHMSDGLSADASYAPCARFSSTASSKACSVLLDLVCPHLSM